MRKIKSFKLFESKEEIEEDVQYIMSAIIDLDQENDLKLSERIDGDSIFIEIISPDGKFTDTEQNLKFYTLIRNKLSQLNGMALVGEIDYDISLEYQTLSPNKVKETKDLDLKEIFNLINNESNNVLSRCTIVLRHK